MPQMCASLTKLGLPTNAPLDNRRLALDVAAVLVRWEQQRLCGPPPVPAVGPNTPGLSVDLRVINIWTLYFLVLVLVLALTQPATCVRLAVAGSTCFPPDDAGALGAAAPVRPSPCACGKA